MNFYKRYMGDFARDTAHLTMIERGAYNDMLDHYYATGRSLPDDNAALYRIAKAMSGAERKAVDTVAARFFPVNGDGTRHNKRADKEIAKHEEQASVNRSIGKLGGRPKKTEVETESDTESVSWKEPNGKPIGEPNRNPNHSQNQKEQHQEANASLSGPLVPDCPQQEILSLYGKHLPTLTQPRIWDGARAELLRKRWRQCSRRNDVWPGYASREEGIAFWDQFFAGVAQSKTLTEGIPRKEGGTWKPDLPWLLKAENFAKVIDGKYHDR